MRRITKPAPASCNGAGQPAMPQIRKNLPPGVGPIVLAYAAFAALWILLSDRVMGWLISDTDTLVLANIPDNVKRLLEEE